MSQIDGHQTMPMRKYQDDECSRHKHFLNQRTNHYLAYECQICSKIKKVCPYRGNKTVQISRNSIQNQSLQHNKTKFYETKLQKPQISFFYKSNIQNSKKVLTISQTAPRERVLSCFVPNNVQEIIFYPVIHNKIVLMQQKVVASNPQQKEKKSNKISYYLKRSKRISTFDKNQSTNQRQPMTPQQFKKISSSFVLNKQAENLKN